LRPTVLTGPGFAFSGTHVNDYGHMSAISDINAIHGIKGNRINC